MVFDVVRAVSSLNARRAFVLSLSTPDRLISFAAIPNDSTMPLAASDTVSPSHLKALTTSSMDEMTNRAKSIIAFAMVLMASIMSRPSGPESCRWSSRSASMASGSTSLPISSSTASNSALSRSAVPAVVSSRSLKAISVCPEAFVM